MRRTHEILIVIIIFIWCTALIYLSRNQDSMLERSNQERNDLDKAFAAIEELQRQNNQLKKIAQNLNAVGVVPINESESKSTNLRNLRLRLQACLQNVESITRNTGHHLDSRTPSKEHEELLRKVQDDIVELLYSTETELNSLKKISGNTESNINGMMERLKTQLRAALLDSEEVTSLDDAWRNVEAQQLQDLVQKRIQFIQNPKDCSKAKQLVCNLNKGCGFGCQVHHLVYCFMVAFGTQRTLIIESNSWRYNPEGWESVFQPVSETCTTAGHPIAPWTGESATSSHRVVNLPIIDGVANRPPYLPLGIPDDLSERLLRLHGNPSVWWVGQFMRYLLRPQAWLDTEVNEAMKGIDFNDPIVGIQVRRTDKVGTEAAYHDVKEYMKHVEDWYVKYELKLVKSKSTKQVTRRVYIASDDATVLADAKKSYPKYDFISDTSISKSASLQSRYSKNSLRGVVVDIFTLSKCNYLVCTFSSQVCRVAYELMQTLHPDASSYFHSLDDVYYYGGQTAHEQIAVLDHDPKPGSQEIELRVGDVVGIAGNHWDGYSKGTNRRTKQTGLYPSYKTKEIFPLVKYPTYPQANAGT
ncbi:alpha-(1,6)-fucosyltransferase-like [Ciona intestinalis]